MNIKIISVNGFPLHDAEEPNSLPGVGDIVTFIPSELGEELPEVISAKVINREFFLDKSDGLVELTVDYALPLG